jgi:hypothetical protein
MPRQASQVVSRHIENRVMAENKGSAFILSGAFVVIPRMRPAAPSSLWASVASDGGPVLQLYFVVGNNGNEIRTVVSGSPSSPPFSAVITSPGTKLGEYPALA